MLQLGRQIRQLGGILAVSSGISALIMAMGATGLWQPLEWFAFDRWLRLHANDNVVDNRFLIVTIDENDLQELEEWPISDSSMAKVLQQLQIYQPRAIGIDIYRDLLVGNGRTELKTALQTIPNVVGVEKVIGEQPVPPASELDPQEQVGISDLVADNDGRIRRGLLAIPCERTVKSCNDSEHHQIKYGLATKLALIYLEQDNIYPRVLDKDRLDRKSVV